MAAVSSNRQLSSRSLIRTVSWDFGVGGLGSVALGTVQGCTKLATNFAREMEDNLFVFSFSDDLKRSHVEIIRKDVGGFHKTDRSRFLEVPARH
jgi:hypothetical protein